MEPSVERYVVEKTVGQGGWADSTPVKEARNASEAVKVLSDLVPDDYGPARFGSAERWREEFNKTAAGFRRITPISEDH